MLSSPRERPRAVFFLGTSRVLVGSYDRAVNGQRFQIRVMADRRDDPLPHAFFAPAREARIRRMPIAQCLIQVAPRTASTGNPQHGLNKQTVVLRRYPAIGGFARKDILDPFLLIISEQCSGHRVWFLLRKNQAVPTSINCVQTLVTID